ncbi:MAG: T9SS C-terminal target domain-containing protein, partial [Bacteroidetes bacterium]
TSKEILLSPNPVENRLTIETKKNILHISIVDLEGKQMEVNRISTTTLDVSTLKTGVYLLIVETAEHDMFKLKFIKN